MPELSHPLKVERNVLPRVLAEFRHCTGWPQRALPKQLMAKGMAPLLPQLALLYHSPRNPRTVVRLWLASQARQHSCASASHSAQRLTFCCADFAGVNWREFAQNNDDERSQVLVKTMDGVEVRTKDRLFRSPISQS